MFPNDSINNRIDYSGSGTTTLIVVPPGDTYTVLYESFNTSSKSPGASLKIDCGATRLLNVNDFANVDSLERFKFGKCTDNVIITVSGTTGSPTTTVSMIYVPRDMAATTTMSETTFPIGPSDIFNYLGHNIEYAVIIGVSIFLLWKIIKKIF